MLWVEKYRPKRIEEVVGEKKIIEKVTGWCEKWKKGIRQKPLLLAGPPGVGKTSLALAIANSMGWEAVELNASDQRSFEIINRIVGEGAFNETISDDGEFLSSREGRLKVIILDEVDNIHKKEDFGGESALLRIVRKVPPQPIILIANDPYALSTELRNRTEFIVFKRLRKDQIVRVLERICKTEGIACDRDVLKLIAENSGGDLRAAINDLQAVAEGSRVITPDDVVISKRTQELDVFKLMQKVFKTKIPAHGDAMLIDQSPDDLIAWIEENLPLEYSDEEMVKGYEVLSSADIYLGRVKRRQFYRLWRYASYLMTTGVQQVKTDSSRGFTRYKPPSLWQKLAYARKRRSIYTAILKKIAKASHMSSKKAVDFYPYIKTLLISFDVPRSAKISAFYDFSIEELEFMVGGDKARDIASYIETHRLHKVEDESFLEGFEVEKREETKEVEKELAKKDEEKKKHEKKRKDLTLDAFFE